MDEKLHAASGLAAYRWGSLVLEASRLAPIDAHAIMRALAGASRGAMPAETDVEQRASIALLHELIHLQQDLTTGLGAWDHIMTRVPYTRLAVQSRALVMPFISPPYRDQALYTLQALGSSPFAQQIQDDLAAIEDHTVGLRQLRGATWATSDVQNLLATRLGKLPSEEDIADLSLRRMLESEAACLTYRTVIQSKHTDLAQEWLDEHKDLWQLPYMGPDYMDLVTVVVHAFAGDDELTGENVLDFFDVVVAIVPWIVDLACAYPDPELLDRSEIDIAAFDPVFRFTEITRCLNGLTADQLGEIFKAILSGDWVQAERPLASSTFLAYPSSTEIYEGWLTLLEPLAGSNEWDAPLFQIRVDAIRSRLEGEPAKGLYGVMAAQTPVQIMVQDSGMRGITHGKYFASWDAMKHALVDRRLDIELFELIYGKGTFVCPYGKATKCPGERYTCVHGIHHLAELPEAPVCYVRRSLQEIGWALPKEKNINV